MEGRRRVLRPSSSLGAARCYATPKLPLRERKTMTTRIETDSLGDVPVPATAYWGAHTARVHAFDHPEAIVRDRRGPPYVERV